MKLLLFSVAASAAVLVGSVTTAEAGPRYSGGYRGGGYGGPSYCPPYNGNYQQHSHHSNHGYYAQPYKVSTVEVSRYSQCRTAYDHYGRPYTYDVTVVTYCDHYSNGTTRTWSQTFS